ncbi:rod shape-determining protein MreD [Caldalkalibacillus uzonensis]|uniref:Rod shape-determining protein MreD n=1 Tax=Caldalkalibacillus uzonensis TaxID=353224 RepID=A0ABU0CT19_9BACI|nr:rod shape-determining protein MreD [Caldalkalibacillus uzonensis]MDQ0339494.1 rod shape-determining protein MreD [Caldalkalibacillus uzonensis]
MTRFLFILTIFTLLIFEGTVVQVFTAGWWDLHLTMVPRFVVVMLIFAALFLGRVQGLFMGLIFGLFYDIIYGSVVGIYAFTMAIIGYFTGLVFRIFQQNIFLIWLTVLLALVAFEFMVYGLMTLVNVTALDLHIFFFDKLLPTLVLNMIFALLVSYPARNILIQMRDEEQQI